MTNCASERRAATASESRQAIEIVERQPHMLLGKLPGVVERARLFEKWP